MFPAMEPVKGGNWSSHSFSARRGSPIIRYSRLDASSPLLVLSREAVSGQVASSIKDMLGDTGAKAVQAMLADVGRPERAYLQRCSAWEP
jgi:membrane protein